MRPAAGPEPGEGAGGAGVPQPRRRNGTEGRGAARGGPGRSRAARFPPSAPRLPCAAPRPGPVLTSRPASAGCRGRDGPNPARRSAHPPAGTRRCGPDGTGARGGAVAPSPDRAAPRRTARRSSRQTRRCRAGFYSAPRTAALRASGPAARAGAAAQRCRLRMAMSSW